MTDFNENMTANDNVMPVKAAQNDNEGTITSDGEIYDKGCYDRANDRLDRIEDGKGCYDL